MKYIILSLSAVLILAASCTKVTTPDTQQDWLRKGNWKVTTATIHNKSTVYHIDTTMNDDALYAINTCNADNSLTFGAVSGGTVNTGTDKCNVSEPDNAPFSWFLVNNGTHLNIYNAQLFFGISSVSATVTNFTKNSFTLQYFYYEAVPDPANAQFRTVNDTFTVTANFSNN